MEKNKLPLIGLTLIIVSIIIVLIGTYFGDPLIGQIGWVMFIVSILFLAILPIIALRDIKSQRSEFETTPKRNCPHCDNVIPKNAKKCHICGKTIK